MAVEIVLNISIDVDPHQREAASPLVLVVCGHFHVKASVADQIKSNLAVEIMSIKRSFC